MMMMMSPIWFLALGELGLAVVGLLWADLRDVPLVYRVDLEAVGQAMVAAAVFSVVNISLYRVARRARRLAGLYAFLENELFPLFRQLKTWDLILLVFLVGLGEEILFRGVLQTEIGLTGASLAFGILHGPSRTLWPLAAWAAVMGACLGLLYQESGNLVIPVLTHAIYDGVAITYAKRLVASNELIGRDVETDGCEKHEDVP